MVFDWIRKLFRRKNRSTNSNDESINQPSIEGNSPVKKGDSPRKKPKKRRLSSSASPRVSSPRQVGAISSSSPSRHTAISKRLAQLEEEDKPLFTRQFAVSKLPKFPKLNLRKPHSYRQNLNCLQFNEVDDEIENEESSNEIENEESSNAIENEESSNDVENEESIDDMIANYGFGLSTPLRHFPLKISLSRISEGNEEH